MLNKRLVYHTRGLAYVRIQAVGMTNYRIKKGVTTCRIKKMAEHTDNQKQRGNAENKTAFYYIRYRQANVLRILALHSGEWLHSLYPFILPTVSLLPWSASTCLIVHVVVDLQWNVLGVPCRMSPNMYPKSR